MRKVLKICSILLVMIGLIICLLPQINNYVFTNEQRKIIKSFDTKIEQLKNINTDGVNNITKYQQLYSDVKQYNETLTSELQSIKLSKKELYQLPAINLTKYGIEDNLYGYIEIPTLDIQMAIYLGSSDYNLSKGAGHIPYTSLPLGGKNTNSVISGHCGYAGINMFRYISTLTTGEEVKITTPFNTLTYKVKSMEVIEPTAVNKLFIKSNKDYITLITCHPYPTNKYRLVVYCERK